MFQLLLEQVITDIVHFGLPTEDVWKDCSCGHSEGNAQYKDYYTIYIIRDYTI